jgi:hypothetical protein
MGGRRKKGRWRDRMQKLDQMAGCVNLYGTARPLDAQRTL